MAKETLSREAMDEIIRTTLAEAADLKIMIQEVMANHFHTASKLTVNLVDFKSDELPVGISLTPSQTEKELKVSAVATGGDLREEEFIKVAGVLLDHANKDIKKLRREIAVALAGGRGSK